MIVPPDPTDCCWLVPSVRVIGTFDVGPNIDPDGALACDEFILVDIADCSAGADTIDDMVSIWPFCRARLISSMSFLRASSTVLNSNG